MAYMHVVDFLKQKSARGQINCSYPFGVEHGSTMFPTYKHPWDHTLTQPALMFRITLQDFRDDLHVFIFRLLLFIGSLVV